MRTIHIKRIKLDFNESDSAIIELKEIEQSEREYLLSLYPNHSVSQLKEMTTISDGYLMIVFSVNEKRDVFIATKF